MTVAIGGTPVGLWDWSHGSQGIWNPQGAQRMFREALAQWLDAPHVRCVGSGKAAFAVILQALHERSRKRQVILPAYTTPALASVVNALGLEVVLADVQEDSCEPRTDVIQGLLNKDTLCVVAVHMFGLPLRLDAWKDILKVQGIPLVEDCAQSLGTTWDGKRIGTAGDVGFSSFGRGKNFSTYGGGVLWSHDREIFLHAENLLAPWPSPSVANAVTAWAGMIAVSTAIRPLWYGAIKQWLGPLRENTVPAGFHTIGYSGVQAAAGHRLLHRLDEWSHRRMERGLRWIQGLRSVQGVSWPHIPDGARPAWNRFPLFIRRRGLRGMIQENLWRHAGVESSTLYGRPIHHIFELGYGASTRPASSHEMRRFMPGGQEGTDMFPNATDVAERLLTLPTHPLVPLHAIDRACEVLAKASLG